MSGEYKQHYNEFKQDPAAFWLSQSKRLPWYKAPETAYTQDQEGLHHWYADGQLNSCFLAVDQHGNQRGLQEVCRLCIGGGLCGGECCYW